MMNERQLPATSPKPFNGCNVGGSGVGYNNERVVLVRDH